MENKAMRHNSGKPQYSLLDLQALEPLVRVLEFGAKKYERNNWKRAMNFDQLLDSLMRHITALQSEPMDLESGIHHIGHILANAMFYSYHVQRLGLPLYNLPKSPEENTSVKLQDQKPSDYASEYEKQWKKDSLGSPTPMGPELHATVANPSPTAMGAQSNTQSVQKKSVGNFTTRPLRSKESDKS